MPLNYSQSQRRVGGLSTPLIVSLLANLLLAGGLLYLFVIQPKLEARDAAETAAAAPPARQSIEALGKIQPEGGVVSLYGPTGERVESLSVQVGDTVTAGQQIATLSGDAQRKSQINALQAQLEEAKALAESIRASSDKRIVDLELAAKQTKQEAEGEIKANEATIAATQAKLTQAKSAIERLKRIEQQNVRVSDAEKERSQAEFQSATEQLKAARAKIESAKEQLADGPALTQAKRETIEAETTRALAQVPGKSLEAGIEAAKSKAEQARVVAPIAGKVIKVDSAVGDTLTRDPIVRIADTSEMIVLAEVYETEVPTLRQWIADAGRVNVEIDPRVFGKDGEPLKGTTQLNDIAPMIAKNTVFALSPREDSDRRVVEVRVTLNKASSKRVTEMIGLQVRVAFLAPTS